MSVELAKEAADADLLVLEGMGRSIETNLTAVFTVDSLKIGELMAEEHLGSYCGSMLVHYSLLVIQ